MNQSLTALEVASASVRVCGPKPSVWAFNLFFARAGFRLLIKLIASHTERMIFMHIYLFDSKVGGQHVSASTTYYAGYGYIWLTGLL